MMKRLVMYAALLILVSSLSGGCVDKQQSVHPGMTYDQPTPASTPIMTYAQSTPASTSDQINIDYPAMVYFTLDDPASTIKGPWNHLNVVLLSDGTICFPYSNLGSNKWTRSEVNGNINYSFNDDMAGNCDITITRNGYATLTYDQKRGYGTKTSYYRKSIRGTWTGDKNTEGTISVEFPVVVGIFHSSHPSSMLQGGPVSFFASSGSPYTSAISMYEDGNLRSFDKLSHDETMSYKCISEDSDSITYVTETEPHRSYIILKSDGSAIIVGVAMGGSSMSSGQWFANDDGEGWILATE